ncbi:hypothetical protein [Campylobacter concisus]|uniref:Uncharacterized protein n=1 Tax=Campylobacter concisus TaxID=199 RepID=A0AAE7NZ76_9BACT|nr:hypothetical protein [Campylobacter concisus]QPH85466.1 hypothetical protein CVT17_03795 [Campylobacter concisus]
MINGVNGFNANANFDFSGARGQNLKTHEEKEADIMGLLRKFSKIGLNVKV